MAEEIINRVAKSPLITIDLGEYIADVEWEVFDFKDHLFQGMILREKDFRTFVKAHDWNNYSGKYVALTCSADAIVPLWAYMLVASKLSGIAGDFIYGDEQDLLKYMAIHQVREQLDVERLSGKKVVIKGCSDIAFPESVYIEVTKLLTPVVQHIMYGEPCSTVPVYKAPKA